jgi:hypothetical protein
MADDTRDDKPEAVDAALGDMKLEEEAFSNGSLSNSYDGAYDHPSTQNGYKRSPSTASGPLKSDTQSPYKKNSASQTPKSEYDEEVIGGDITVTVEPGKVPKLSRKHSQKVISRPAPLFDDLEDATNEAISVFQVIKDCIYGSRYMGSSEHDPLDCDCSEEWRKFFQHLTIATD